MGIALLTQFAHPARLWDLPNARLIAALEGHRREIYTVNFSRDGRYAATGSGDGDVRLWEVPSGRLSRVLRVGRPTWALQFSHNDKLLATANPDQARIFDL